MRVATMQRRAALLPWPPLEAQGLPGLLWVFLGVLLCFRGRLPSLEKMLVAASLRSEAVFTNGALVCMGFAGDAAFVELCVCESACRPVFAGVQVVKISARFQARKFLDPCRHV